MPATPHRPFSRPRRASPGFTLIELAIVLVVGGILIGAGLSAWQGFRESRRLALAASQLYQIKDCLAKRVIRSERYPSWNSSASYTFCQYSFLDVDACMCQNGAGMADPWGTPIRFLAGVDTAGLNLGDRSGSTLSQIVATDKARNQTRVAPASASNATDHRGAAKPDVAYILISYGSDKTADHTSYGSLFTATGSTAVLNPANRPDFQTGHKDDVYLVVPSQELVSTVEQE